MVGCYGSGPRIFPESVMKETKKPPQVLVRSKGMHADWLAACKGGPQPHGGFDYSAKLVEIMAVGNLALRLGKKIEWDAKAGKAVNCPEADAIVHRPYRKGWEV